MPVERTTAAQRRVGLELRKMRLARKMTLDDVAHRMEWSMSKLSRVETAQSGILARDVRLLCELFDAGSDVTDGLVELARRARLKGWWQPYKDLLGSHYIPFEAEATAVHEYGIEILPGLLQTADYARAIMRGSRSGADSEELERRVQVRTDRQVALDRVESPLLLWSVISEAALRRRIGGADVMRAQLKHVLARSENPNVDVQVLPFDAGAHPSLSTCFVILRFASGGPVVFEDGVAETREIDDPHGARSCIEAFDYLRAAAESPERSRALIDEAVRAL